MRHAFKKDKNWLSWWENRVNRNIYDYRDGGLLSKEKTALVVKPEPSDMLEFLFHHKVTIRIYTSDEIEDRIIWVCELSKKLKKRNVFIKKFGEDLSTMIEDMTVDFLKELNIFN